LQKLRNIYLDAQDDQFGHKFSLAEGKKLP